MSNFVGSYQNLLQLRDLDEEIPSKDVLDSRIELNSYANVEVI